MVWAVEPPKVCSNLTVIPCIVTNQHRKHEEPTSRFSDYPENPGDMSLASVFGDSADDAEMSVTAGNSNLLDGANRGIATVEPESHGQGDP